MERFQRKLWVGLLILALLTPIGIFLPEMFNAGDAWGEWGVETLEKLLGYIPEGLKKYAGFWKEPIPDYNLGGDDASNGTQAFSYILSGIIGIVLVGLILFGISKFLVRHER